MTESAIQVDKSHYEFPRYMSKPRWISVWHQLDEVIRLKPKKVLEIGPGPGLFKQAASVFGIDVETLDLDPELKPDHIGSATELPFADNSYDVVCAFQMLEHLPYEAALLAFREMVRVSKEAVVISLPDAKPVWHFRIHIPKLGTRDFLLPRLFFKPPIHEFDGEHYWEVNKKQWPLKKAMADFGAIAFVVNTYRTIENASHRFIVFSKIRTPQVGR